MRALLLPSLLVAAEHATKQQPALTPRHTTELFTTVTTVTAPLTRSLFSKKLSSDQANLARMPASSVAAPAPAEADADCTDLQPPSDWKNPSCEQQLEAGARLEKRE